MYTELTLDGFIEEFKNYNREDNFSIAGLEALYDYLDSSEGFYILDVIYVCETFTEYKSVEDINKDGYEFETLEDVYDEFMVIEFDGGFIIFKGRYTEC